jgi:DNA-binding transcriptional ArsR family regulator
MTCPSDLVSPAPAAAFDGDAGARTPDAAIDADRIYKALANPFRRQILTWLKAPADAFASVRIDLNHGVPPNAIHARSGLSQSTVSAHLAALIDARLLVAKRMGQWTFLSRNEALICAFARQMTSQL